MKITDATPEEPELVTVAAVGWPALRLHVFNRDRGCVAAQRSIVGDAAASDLCRDGQGMLMPWNDPWKLEFMHVKQYGALGVKALDDEAHGVAGCPWHHRGSGWGTRRSSLEAMRAHLRKLYPAVWDAAPRQPFGVLRTLR